MSQRDRTALMFVAAVVLLAALWFVVVSPERNKASAAGAALGSAKARLASAAADERNARVAQATLNTNVGVISALTTAVPANHGGSPLPDELQSTPQRQGGEFPALQTQVAGDG